MISWVLFPMNSRLVGRGHAGFESQGLGLAEALGGEIVVKRIEPRLPWIYMPPWVALPPLDALTPASDPLEPPWPDVVISCGRRVVGFALALRRVARGRTLAVHIQDPLVDPRRFDLVAAPLHDDLKGSNVVATRAALHRVTPEKLAAAASVFAPLLAKLPRPLVAVLIGGSSGRHRLNPAVTGVFCDRLAALVARYGAGLAVTPSRRTGRENEAVLCERLAALPAHVWNGVGANPYFAYLALADAIVVTGDSVSMVSEAIATGKPVYIVDLGGDGGRLRRFHQKLQESGITRVFDGTLATWHYNSPDDTVRVASAVRRLLTERRAGRRAVDDTDAPVTAQMHQSP